MNNYPERNTFIDCTFGKITAFSIHGCLLYTGLLSCLFALAWCVSWFKTINWIGFFLICLHIFACLFAVRKVFKKGPADIFHPIVFFCIFFILPMIILKGLLLVFEIRLSPLFIDLSKEEYLNAALFGSLVGTVALLLGFKCNIGGSISEMLPRFSVLFNRRRLKLWRILLCYLIGCCFIVILMRTDLFGSSLVEFSGLWAWVNWFQQFSNWPRMCLFVLVFLLARGAHKKIQLSVAAVIGTIALIAMTMFSGSRSALLWVVITCIAAVQYSRYPHLRAGSLKNWALLAVAALFLGIVVMSSYRMIRAEEYSTESISISNSFDLGQKVLRSLSLMNIKEIWSFFGAKCSERLGSIDEFARTLELGKLRSIKNLEREAGIDNNIVKDFLYGFVPRAVWPDKPIVANFGLHFYRIYHDSPHLAWSGPSIFGDLWRNFGWLGIPLGMFLLGIFLRVIYQKLIVEGCNSLSAVLYFYLLTGINFEGQYSFLSGWFRTIFVWVVLYWVITQKTSSFYESGLQDSMGLKEKPYLCNRLANVL